MTNTIRFTAQNLFILVLTTLPNLSFGSPNIYGSDHRERVTQKNLGKARYAVGAILGESYDFSSLKTTQIMCTGTIISTHLVLTAAHCVLDQNTGELLLQSLRFVSEFKQDPETGVIRKSKSYTLSVVKHGLQAPTKTGWNSMNDWAILKAESPIGDIYGKIEMTNLDFSKPKNLTSWQNWFTLAGYSGDYFRKHGESGVHNNCSIRSQISQTAENLEVGELLHDCDMSHGASGGAILAYLSPTLEPYNPTHGTNTNYKWYVVAINVAEITEYGHEHFTQYDRAFPNIAIPVVAATKAYAKLPK